MEKDKLYIQGSCCLTSVGVGIEDWLNALEQNREIPPLIDPEKYSRDIADINKEPYKMHRIQKVLAVTVVKALAEAGIEITADNSARIAVLLGNAYGIEQFKGEYMKLFLKDKFEFIPPSLFVFGTPNSISANLSVKLGLKGINLTFFNGATSASEGIIAAKDILTSGRADVAVVVGVNFFCDPFDDELFRCGFRNECCAAIVLAREINEDCNNSEEFFLIKDLSHGFMCGNLHEYDQLSNKTIGDDIDCTILNQGNSFHCRPFSDKSLNIHKIEDNVCISMENLLGNTFSASGILGSILSAEIIKRQKVAGLSIDGNIKRLLFINCDSYGSYTSLTTEKCEIC